MEAGFQAATGLPLLAIAILARDVLYGLLGAGVLAAAHVSSRTSTIAAQLSEARQRRNERLTIPLGKGELAAGPAEALILFTNGKTGAELRAVRPDPNIDTLLERARTAVYPVQFPDDAPAHLAGWGEMRCVSGECALRLALRRRPRAEK
jgi:hypothetical protein